MDNFPLTNFTAKSHWTFRVKIILMIFLLALLCVFLLLNFVKDQRNTHYHRKRALFAKGVTKYRKYKKCYKILYSCIYSRPNAYRLWLFIQDTLITFYCLDWKNPSVLWKCSVFGITTLCWCGQVSACLLKIFGNGQHVNPHPPISHIY